MRQHCKRLARPHERPNCHQTGWQRVSAAPLAERSTRSCCLCTAPLARPNDGVTQALLPRCQVQRRHLMISSHKFSFTALFCLAFAELCGVLAMCCHGEPLHIWTLAIQKLALLRSIQHKAHATLSHGLLQTASSGREFLAMCICLRGSSKREALL